MVIARRIFTALAGLAACFGVREIRLATAGPVIAADGAELFAPNVISTRDYERDGAFTPDGKTFYFTKRTMWPYFSAICVSHLEDGRWSEPEVAPFSGQYPDGMPFVSVDGSRLYFASHRPFNGATTPGYSIWVVDRVGESWSAPRRLPAPINDHGSVIHPVETRDGSLYFIRGDIPHAVVARRQGDGWKEPQLAGDDNAPDSWETAAYVDADERYMIVAVTGRSDAMNTAEGVYARADLYSRTRVGDGWSPLRHLDAPINSAAEEGAPFVSPDGKFLYFMSERGVFTEHGPALDAARLETALHSPRNGLGDFYRVPFTATGIKLPPSQPNSTALQLFADGVVSTSDDEFGGSFTPNGDTIYFSKSAPHSYRYTMLESHRSHGQWTTPTVLPFSGRYTDSDPTLSPDGKRMLWSSDRPISGTTPNHDYDIWMVERTASGAWGPPTRLPEPINSRASEYAASMTRDGTLYFSSAREGAIQAYRSKFVDGHWTTPENMTRLINGGDTTIVAWDLDVMIDPDERFLMLGSLRQEGFGNYDVYVSWNENGKWTRAVHLPAPFNTSARDYAPHLAPDGKTLYLSSERSFAQKPLDHPLMYRELTDRLRGTLNGSGNIYHIDLSAIEAFRPSVRRDGSADSLRHGLALGHLK